LLSSFFTGQSKGRSKHTRWMNVAEQREKEKESKKTYFGGHFGRVCVECVGQGQVFCGGMGDGLGGMDRVRKSDARRECLCCLPKAASWVVGGRAKVDFWSFSGTGAMQSHSNHVKGKERPSTLGQFPLSRRLLQRLMKPQMRHLTLCCCLMSDTCHEYYIS